MTKTDKEKAALKAEIAKLKAEIRKMRRMAEARARKKRK